MDDDDADYMQGSDDEDYGFDYSDGEEVEETGDAALENAYYTAKSRKEDDPEEALKLFKAILEKEEKKGDWGFKALKQATKLLFLVLHRPTEALETYTLLLTYTKSAVTRNYSEKTINNILDYVGGGKGGSVDVDVLERFYQVTKDALDEAKNERLSAKTNLKLAKLWLDRKEYTRLSKLIRELHELTDLSEDQQSKGTQLLEIYALEIQMYNETKNYKKLKEIYNATNEVRSAIPHPRIMGVIKECGGKMWMGEKQWDRASEDFFESFKNYDEAGSPQRIQVLKYLVLANMLTGSAVSPFDSQETKPYKNDTQIKAMTDLVDAYQRREVHAAEKILRDNRATITDDPFIRHYTGDLLRSLRTQYLIDLIKPYTRLELAFLAKQLNVDKEEVEEMLIDLILEGKVEGRIDQVEMRLELDRHQHLEKRRYAALERWTEALEGVHSAVVNKVSGGRAGDGSMQKLWNVNPCPRNARVMESPQVPTSPTYTQGQLKSSNSSTKFVDDVTSLTSFNPFSEEDEHDQSSYTLVSSLFSRVKNSFASPLTSAVAAASGTTSNTTPTGVVNVSNDAKIRPSDKLNPGAIATNVSPKILVEKPRPFKIVGSSEPTLALSVEPAVSVTPTLNFEQDGSTSKGNYYYSPTSELPDGGMFGTAIPGFPIQDDTRSIHTNTSLKRSLSVSKVIRRIRGEGLSRDYWMDDENCKECYDCKSVFTAWRRKHHCRICGQIFCSRCASNIIKGSRFGHDGMLRVCNLCLEKLNYDDDDDDDRRSIISSFSSPYPYHNIESHQPALGYHSQSPFSASQLFGRTDEPYNLFSIAETKHQSYGSDGDAMSSRPITPGEDTAIQSDEQIGDQIAPFRRGVADEEKEPLVSSEPFPGEQSPTRSRSGAKTPLDVQTSVPFPATNSKSSIQFPRGSPEQLHGSDSPRPTSMFRSRVNSYADTEAPTPFLRSRVQSRLNDLNFGEPGWRMRRESTAYAQELNSISMFHLRVMLRQLLTAEGISNIKEWEETLSKLALRIARDLTFTAYPNREGADMDVRRYVKIKKIPGGSPKDSEYVDGAVITKNVAHKQMLRSQKNPRVMLVTFPLEFQRIEGQYMHFGQIVRQEKEYLRNLASRIAALRPHVVLVEQSVSRLALEELVKHNITVARTVKKSAIQFVARMTQADIFSSMDKLALEPRLGHCGLFRIQTFDHILIPGRRKTYMRFEGCLRDMGCTIILRGGDIDHLKRVKKVALFLTFIVRNLKLETHLWKDSLITAPHLTSDSVPQYYMQQCSPLLPPADLSLSGQDEIADVSLSDDSGILDTPNEEARSYQLSRRIQDSLNPYLKTFISVSATLRFLPPYPIRKMKELDDELRRAKRAWEDEIISREEKIVPQHVQEETITPDSMSCSDDIKTQIDLLPAAGFEDSPLTESSSASKTESSGTDYFSRKLASSVSFSSLKSSSNSAMFSDEMTDNSILRNETDIAAQSCFEQVQWQHDEQLRVWEWYLRKNKDDFIVDKYQRISLMEFTLPISELGHHRACFPPQLKYITFYGENDCTLGQFIEKSVHETLLHSIDPRAICPGKGCEEPLARHCQVFVHNESRIFIYVEQWDGQIKTRTNTAPLPDLITTWSACRICGSATPFIPMSEEMQRYSFAKFLELHFYPADVQLVQGAGCVHNIYQHHTRYFAVRGMSVMFQTDPITMYEIVLPPSRIYIKAETLLNLKNGDYERLLKRNSQWYSALVEDLKLINVDAAVGDEEADAKLTSEIKSLIHRAENERTEMARLIQQVYKESSPIDTLALNRVRADRQDRIVAWQLDFDKLPRPKSSQISERDSRKLTAFNSVRAMWPKRHDLPAFLESLHLPSSHVSEAEEIPPLLRRVTGESIATASSASDMSDLEMSPKVVPISTTNALSPPTPMTEEMTPIATSVKQSGSDSDSTIAPIGLQNHNGDLSDLPSQDENSGNDAGSSTVPVSRLPRRSGRQTTVAELVKKYQEYLPESVSRELASTALAPAVPPLINESDQEILPVKTIRAKAKIRPKAPYRKDSVSDFEHSYAANVAPRYLTSRRPLSSAGPGTRIPGPTSSVDSRDSSRRTSPDKRPSSSNAVPEGTLRGGRASPPPSKYGLSAVSRNGNSRTVGRTQTKDRPTMHRASSMTGTKSTIRKVSNAGPGGKVSNIARHFERIHRDSERANRRYAVIRGRRVRPVASAKATVEVFESVKEAIKDESEASDSSSEADDEDEGEEENAQVRKKPKAPVVLESQVGACASLPQNEVAPADLPQKDEREELGTNAVLQAEDAPVPSLPSSPLPTATSSRTSCETPPASDAEAGPSQMERHLTLMKAITGFWPPHVATGRGLIDFEGDDPMADPEHIFRDSSMVVRTDEPTSIIALALNSPQYRELLSKSRADKKHVREPKLSEGGEAFMPDDVSVAESTSTWGVVNVDSTDDGNPTDDLRVPSSKLPWAISIESGGLTITCTILYPEQFDALRRTYDCDKIMIESLARCVKWNASGGKSGSAFLKTRDDRFIAKELSKAELETMTTFAPAYFDYMSSAVTAKRPTLLAKVFGCFKIVFKKTAKDKDRPARSKSTQMSLLVMENLFYDKRFSKIFDLKGSTRNRHVQSTGRENEVLLDENLVQTAHLAPFYVREHAKRILRGALFNDTKFLADINVMDYSLVVGVDSQKNELVVGIVDYIRTYTWDKRLESWVKESAILTGAGKGEPTIVTPRQYRQRFLSAMERYLPLVPDRWMKQRDSPEEEGNSLLDLWPDW